MLATKSARSPGVLPGWCAGATDAVVGPLYSPGRFLFLSSAVAGVGTAVLLSWVWRRHLDVGECIRDLAYAEWPLFVSREAPGVAKFLPRITQAVAWCDPCSPAPFVIVAGPDPPIAGTDPRGVFSLPSTWTTAATGATLRGIPGSPIA